MFVVVQFLLILLFPIVLNLENGKTYSIEKLKSVKKIVHTLRESSFLHFWTPPPFVFILSVGEYLVALKWGTPRGKKKMR